MPNDETRSTGVPQTRARGQGRIVAVRPVSPAARQIDRTVRQQSAAVHGVADLARRADARSRIIVRRQGEMQTRHSALADMRAAATRNERRRDVLNEATVRNANAGYDSARDREIAQLRRNNRDLQTRLARPNGPDQRRAAQSQRSQLDRIYRRASLDYLRTGQDMVQTPEGMVHMRDLQSRAMHGETFGQGGVFLRPEYDTGPIEKMLLERVTMRAIATVKTTDAPSFKKVLNVRGTSAHWAGEREARGETNTPELVELETHAFELFANPHATQQQLEDAGFDVESWLAEEVNEAFATQETDAHFGGDGVNKPRGLLTYEMVDEDTFRGSSDREKIFKFGVRKTGVSGAFGAGAAGTDLLIRLSTDLPQGHRSQASWLMQRTTIGITRTLKDGNGEYVFRGANQENPQDTLQMFPIIEAEEMPEIGADSLSIGFGDWKKTYMVLDRLGVSVLRDPYSAKPWVGFYTRKRVGGGAVRFDAAKFIQFSA